MSRADIFRRNLRRLAKVQVLDCDALAQELGLGREQRKWLWRLWENGVATPNAKTAADWKRLANFLGVAPEQMWAKDCIPNARWLAEGNYKEFSRLTYHLLFFNDMLPHLQAEYPKELAAMELKYGRKNDLVARWLASRLYDAPTLEPVEKKLISQMEVEYMRARTQYDEAVGLVGQVLARCSRHPAWVMFKMKLVASNVPKGGDPQWHLESAIRSVSWEAPSADEVYRRIRRKWLDTLSDRWGKTPSDLHDADELDQVLDDLMNHPNWLRYVNEKQHGSTEDALSFVAESWQKAKQQLGVTLTRHGFTTTFIKQFMNSFDVPPPTPGEMGANMSNSSVSDLVPSKGATLDELAAEQIKAEVQDEKAYKKWKKRQR